MELLMVMLPAPHAFSILLVNFLYKWPDASINVYLGNQFDKCAYPLSEKL